MIWNFIRTEEGFFVIEKLVDRDAFNVLTWKKFYFNFRKS